MLTRACSVPHAEHNESSSHALFSAQTCYFHFQTTWTYIFSLHKRPCCTSI